MIELQLYSPKELDIKIQLPTEWNELDGEEVRHLCSRDSGGDDMADAQRRMVLFFIEHRAVAHGGHGDKQHSAKGLTREQVMRLDKEVLCELIPVFDFVFEQINLTMNKLPEVMIDGVRYIGPKDAFADTTAGEYETILILLLKYYTCVEKDDTEKADGYLREMFRNAYRRPNENTEDRRQQRAAFEGFEPEMPADKIPDEYVQAFRLYFSSCNNMLTKLFPAVYPPSPKGEKGKASHSDLLNFTRCIHAAAGPKNGKRDEVRRLPIMELMFDMNEEAKAAAKMTM